MKTTSLFTQIAFLAILLYAHIASFGQVAQYQFSHQQGIYQTMNDGMVIQPNAQNGYQIPLNMIFNFNGVANDSVVVHQNGYLFFGATSSFSANNTPLSFQNYPGSVKGIISAFGNSLSPRTTQPGSEIRYRTIGQSPNKRCEIEWRNFTRSSSINFGQEDDISFKITLYETSGIVQIQYGAMQLASAASGLDSVQVGLRGTSIFDFKNKTGNWANPANGTDVRAAMRIVSPGNTASLPVSGMVYRFSPLVAPTITLQEPNGGNTYIGGQFVSVIFTSSIAANIDLEFTTNNGASWQPIYGAFPAQSGLNQYTWLVPNNVQSNQCLVRARWVNNSGNFDVSDNFFSITPPPTASIIYPSGGQTFNEGEIVQVLWSAANVQNIDLEYSFNNLHWNVIGQNIQASTGMYAWQLPMVNISQQNVIVRIKNHANGNVLQVIQNPFAIMNISGLDTITVVSPNGGEIYAAGSMIQIQWNASSNIQWLNLYFKTDTAQAWQSVPNTTLNASLGTYHWQAPNVNSAYCLIKLVDANTQIALDSSDAYFTIGSPYIRFLSPTGGESFTSGTTITISWEMLGVQRALIEFTDNNWATSTIIYEDLLGGATSYDFQIPGNINSTQCKFIIQDADNLNVFGETSSFITITPGTVSLTENLQNTFKIYPNPTSDFIKMEGILSMDQYEIFDFTGRKVESGKLNSNNTISVQHLPKGNYFLRSGKMRSTFIKR